MTTIKTMMMMVMIGTMMMKMTMMTMTVMMRMTMMMAMAKLKKCFEEGEWDRLQLLFLSNQFSQFSTSFPPLFITI